MEKCRDGTILNACETGATTFAPVLISSLVRPWEGLAIASLQVRSLTAVRPLRTSLVNAPKRRALKIVSTQAQAFVKASSPAGGLVRTKGKLVFKLAVVTDHSCPNVVRRDLHQDKVVELSPYVPRLSQRRVYGIKRSPTPTGNDIARPIAPREGTN